MTNEVLNRNYEFQRVYKQARSFVTPYFVIYARKNKKINHRIGFTVSKKIGNAVTRNRARRRLKEAFRMCALPENTGYDIVIVARKPSLTVTFEKMVDRMNRELQKIRIKL